MSAALGPAAPAAADLAEMDRYPGGMVVVVALILVYPERLAHGAPPG
jgi:hypothetical protein